MDTTEMKESPKENKVTKCVESESRNFDLNAGAGENSEKTGPVSTTAPPPPDVKGEEFPGLSEMDRMAIDPVHLAQLSSRLDEDEEDYDEEG